MIENLDRLPEDEEEITTEDGITLQVKGINQNRIVKVLMTLPEETDEEQEESDEESEEAADKVFSEKAE